ncbi:unnamed protein product [Timema podura]|uniref:Uncharacterized protein n=1 Tax=Timema podura TaxID=61482 RepID=A0ABN7NWK7_TIMPD|nr:unnamed protein product [Timema podura]
MYLISRCLLQFQHVHNSNVS